MKRLAVFLLALLLAAPVYAQQGQAVGPIPPCSVFGTTSGTCLQGAGALGSPLSIGTLPAFTLGGTIAGGGNQINNAVGSFTTLGATTALGLNVAGGTSTFITVTGNNADVGISFIDTGRNNWKVGSDITAVNTLELYDSTASASRFQITTAGLVTVKQTFAVAAMGADTAQVDSTVCRIAASGLLVTGTGALGTCLGTSGRQFKTAFAPMVAGLDDLMKVDFQTYRYRDGFGDNGASLQYGTTAQDVEKARPDLVRYSDAGEAINYDSGALLFIGLHAIQQLKADNDKLRACQDSWKCRVFGISQ